jgi:ATP-dependent helicase HrpB
MSEALAVAALERGPAAFAPEGEPARTLARVRFLRGAMPELELPELGEAEVALAVRQAAMGRRRFSELREGGVVALLLSGLSAAQRAALESGAPAGVRLPSGRQAGVQYEEGKPPWIESRLQDFFGWTDAPKLAQGRVALTLHLMAPNHRVQQVTSDLAGFWDRTYPAVRREWMRRYPRHAWPENPRKAPPAKTPRSIR